MNGLNLSVFLRSMFFETLWNYEKMQNIGFALCIHPVLERLYPDGEKRKEALLRHREQVNTHPSMSPLLVGIVARLEQDLEPATTMSYRRRLMSVLAAHGDRLIWNHVKPLASVCGTLASLLWFGSIAGSLVFLTLYNLPNIALRAGGFGTGWDRGLEVLAWLKSERLERFRGSVRHATTIGLGATAGLLVLMASNSGVDAFRQTFTIPVAVLLAAGSFVFLRRKVPFTVVMYLTALLGLAILTVIHSGQPFTGTAISH